MAYITNAQEKVLISVFEQLNTKGKVDYDTMYDFFEVIKKIDIDKHNAREKARKSIAEKRKVNKNYAR